MLTVCAFPHTQNKGLPYCTPTWELRWDRLEVGVHCLTVVSFHCVTYDYAVERPPETGCVMLIMGTGGSFCCFCDYNSQINTLEICKTFIFFSVSPSLLLSTCSCSATALLCFSLLFLVDNLNFCRWCCFLWVLGESITATQPLLVLFIPQAK